MRAQEYKSKKAEGHKIWVGAKAERCKGMRTQGCESTMVGRHKGWRVQQREDATAGAHKGGMVQGWEGTRVGGCKGGRAQGQTALDVSKATPWTSPRICPRLHLDMSKGLSKATFGHVQGLVQG